MTNNTKICFDKANRIETLYDFINEIDSLIDEINDFIDNPYVYIKLIIENIHLEKFSTDKLNNQLFIRLSDEKLNSIKITRHRFDKKLVIKIYNKYYYLAPINENDNYYYNFKLEELTVGA